MTIGKKIVLSAAVMVFLAVALTASGVLTLLNQGIETQTSELIAELTLQSGQRLETGKKILLNAVSSHILRVNQDTTDISLSNGMQSTVANGQWKALFALIAETCQNGDIDFMVVFDAHGSVLTTFPDGIDGDYPETHFKGLHLFQTFRPAITAMDLTRIQAVASFEKWDPQIRQGYGLDPEGSIVVLSACVIPSEFLDEPIGFVLSGIDIRRLKVPFQFFSDTTGLASLLIYQGMPLIWSGVPGARADIAKGLASLDLDEDQTGAGGAVTPASFDSNAFHLSSAPLVRLFSQTRIGIPTTLSDCSILVGEPARLIRQASDKITTEGEEIKSRILFATLAVASMILALAIAFMGLISRRIARPVALAAKMSNRIASGDLSTVLDESSRDETGVLSRAMNQMVKNLKILEDRNRSQMEALKESELRNKRIIDSIQNGVLLIDAHTREIIDANPAILKMIHANREDIVGQICDERLCPKEELACYPSEQASFPIHFEHRLQTMDGRYLQVLKTILPINLNNRSCLLETIVDLTRITQAEVALRDSEEKFRTLFNTSHQAIGLIKKETARFIDANDRFCEISQYRKSQIIGKHAAQMGFHAEEDRFIEKLVQAGQVVTEEMNFKVNEGGMIRILLYGAPIRIKEEDCFLIEFYDITEKKRLESQLKQSHKMESIGTLAGGIAHDFNNILAIILSNTEMAMEQVVDGHPVWSQLDAVKTASLRAAEIVSQLLSFSRSTEQSFKIVDITAVIGDTLKFMRSTIPSSILIDHKIETDRMLVKADPVQINQIIMNLCINASHAMEDAKGTIKLRTHLAEVDRETAMMHQDLRPGRYVQIDISDDGKGIPEEILPRIFDPYFTTKEVGKGTGMGLAVVVGIVKAHCGAVLVESLPGHGSCFSVYLPLADRLPDSETESEPRGITPGTGTLLFVDDDSAITDIFDQMLTQIGYQVHVFTDPFEALNAFKEAPQAFDLLITDMSMPGMTGADLLREVRTIRSSFPVIVCTGHSELMDQRRAVENKIDAFIMKPIPFRDMARTIHKVLERGGPNA